MLGILLWCMSALLFVNKEIRCQLLWPWYHSYVFTSEYCDVLHFLSVLLLNSFVNWVMSCCSWITGLSRLCFWMFYTTQHFFVTQSLYSWFIQYNDRHTILASFSWMFPGMYMESSCDQFSLWWLKYFWVNEVGW